VELKTLETVNTIVAVVVDMQQRFLTIGIPCTVTFLTPQVNKKSGKLKFPDFL